jgi:DNA topoisomerase-1
MIVGGARPDGRKRWTTLSHRGVAFPVVGNTYKKKNTPPSPVLVTTPNRATVALALEAKVALFDYLRKGGTNRSFMGKEIYARNFWDDWSTKLLTPKQRSVLGTFARCDLTAAAAAAAAAGAATKTATTSEAEATKSVAERHGFATVDGSRVPLISWMVDRPGVFVGRTKHARLTGRIRRPVTASDVTINVGEGKPAPSAPRGQRWGAVVHDPTVDWVASWRDPLTQTMKYTRLASRAASEQTAAHDRFDQARTFNDKDLSNLRARVVAVLKDPNVTLPQQQVFACIWLITELGLRVGSGGHRGLAAMGGAYGATTLLTRHVSLIGRGGVRLDFPAKDGVRYTRTLKCHGRSEGSHVGDICTSEYLSRYLKVRIASDVGGGATRGGGALFPDVPSSSLINDALTASIPTRAISAKVIRTARASAIFEATIDRLNPGDHWSKADVQLALRIANARVALFCNHRKKSSTIVDLAEFEKRLDAIVEDFRKTVAAAKGPAARPPHPPRVKATSATAARLNEQVLKPASLILTTSRKSYVDPRIEWALLARLPKGSSPEPSAAASAALWAAAATGSFRFSLKPQ